MGKEKSMTKERKFSWGVMAVAIGAVALGLAIGES